MDTHLTVKVEPPLWSRSWGWSDGQGWQDLCPRCYEEGGIMSKEINKQRNTGLGRKKQEYVFQSAGGRDT